MPTDAASPCWSENCMTAPHITANVRHGQFPHVHIGIEHKTRPNACSMCRGFCTLALFIYAAILHFADADGWSNLRHAGHHQSHSEGLKTPHVHHHCGSGRSRLLCHGQAGLWWWTVSIVYNSDLIGGLSIWKFWAVAGIWCRVNQETINN